MATLASLYHNIRFWVLITLLSLLFGIAAVSVRCFDSTGNTSHRICSLWSRLQCFLNGIRVEVTGWENINLQQAQIFVANHQSFFDIFALDGYLPVQIRWVSKSSIFKIPFVGWAMKASGYIAVDRENKRKAYEAFMATVETLKAGNSVVIFPEGTRSDDGQMKDFKKGGHLLALRSGAPLVPVTVIGTGKILKKGEAIIHPGTIRLIISPPVKIDKSSAKKDDNILKGIRATIHDNLERHHSDI